MPLRIIGYPIQPGLFSIIYLSNSNAGWSDAQVYLVFGSGPVLLFAIGLWLVGVLKRISGIHWKLRLVLTWMAFLMVNVLPCGIVAGAFFFDSFGIAFQWINGNFLARGMISVGIIMFMLFFNHFWLMLFVRAAYSQDFIQKGEHRRIFVINTVFKPLIYGFFILLFFAWPFKSLYWPVSLFIFGYILIPTSDRLLRSPNLHVPATDNKIFSSLFQKVLFILGLVLLWFANYTIITSRINFF